MTFHSRRISAIALLFSLSSILPSAAQSPHPVMTLPASGSFHGGGTFQGTVSINRFEQRNGRAVAIGFVSGVLTRANRTVGTAVVGEIAWPVAAKSGGIAVANGPAPGEATPALITFNPEGRYLRVQAASCPVLDVALGPINVDLLGFQVALGGIALNIAGESGTPLGDLVCAASDLLGNVAGIVNLLNSLLGLVTGLLGGLTGGLGGAVPLP